MENYYYGYQSTGLTVPSPPEGMRDWHQTIGLTAQEPDYLIDGSVTKVKMGLGWDAGCDIDGSVVVFDSNLQHLDTVWWRQLSSRDGAIKHSGDDQTGEGGGDDEVIKVKLTKIHPRASHLLFVVCVYTPGMSFRMVRSAYVRMMHGKKKHNSHVLASFNLSNMDGNAMIMGVLTRKGAYWNFRALGIPSKGRTALEASGVVIQDPVCGQCMSGCETFPPQYRKIHVSVQEGRDLAIKDKGLFGRKGSSDPYVEVRLDKIKAKSDVIKKNLNPKWNMIPVDLGKILESNHKAVKFTVFDYDLTGDDFMGVVRIPVSALYKAGPGNHEWWVKLTPSKEGSYAGAKVKGEIKVCVYVKDVDK